MVYVKEVNNKNELQKIVGLTSFQKPQFQSILILFTVCLSVPCQPGLEGSDHGTK